MWPLGEEEIKGGWTRHETYVGENAALLRIRHGSQELARAKEWTHVVRAIWEYAEKGSGAMPTPDQVDLMRTCEAFLVEAFETNHFGLMTHTSICDGLCVWFFYVKDDFDGFHERVQETLPLDEPFPIEFVVCPDRDWTEYRSARLRCQPAT
jgi:hypothetical protein